MRILVVEDEPALAASVAKRLKDEGFVADHFASLGEAVEAVMNTQYRAVLLDRRLPDGDGLSLLPILRTRPLPPPVIILTAMDDVADRVGGLNAGADDYLIKPFAFDELMARLRVLLRRDPSSSPAPAIKLGGLEYAISTREARVNGATLSIPRRELAILDVLMRRAGRVVRREHIEEQVYGYDDEISSNALETHVSRLRRRLSDARAGVVLHGVRGIGYIMRAS